MKHGLFYMKLWLYEVETFSDETEEYCAGHTDWNKLETESMTSESIFESLHNEFGSFVIVTQESIENWIMDTNAEAMIRISSEPYTDADGISGIEVVELVMREINEKGNMIGGGILEPEQLSLFSELD